MLQIAAFPFWVYATLLMIPIIILCFCCWRFIGRRRRERDHYERIHYERVAAPERIVEKERIVERVLVVCPYCGHKNEQGMSKCGECGADL